MNPVEQLHVHAVLLPFDVADAAWLLQFFFFLLHVSLSLSLLPNSVAAVATAAVCVVVNGVIISMALSTNPNTMGLLNRRHFARLGPSDGMEALITCNAGFGQSYTRWESVSEGPSSPSWRWRGTTLTTGAVFNGHLLTCCWLLSTALQYGHVIVFLGGGGVEEDLLLGAAGFADGTSSRVLPLLWAVCDCTSQAGYGSFLCRRS